MDDFIASESQVESGEQSATESGSSQDAPRRARKRARHAAASDGSRPAPRASDGAASTAGAGPSDVEYTDIVTPNKFRPSGRLRARRQKRIDSDPESEEDVDRLLAQPVQEAPGSAEPRGKLKKLDRTSEPVSDPITAPAAEASPAHGNATRQLRARTERPKASPAELIASHQARAVGRQEDDQASAEVVGEQSDLESPSASSAQQPRGKRSSPDQHGGCSLAVAAGSLGPPEGSMADFIVSDGEAEVAGPGSGSGAQKAQRRSASRRTLRSVHLLLPVSSASRY